MAKPPPPKRPARPEREASSKDLTRTFRERGSNKAPLPSPKRDYQNRKR